MPFVRIDIPKGWPAAHISALSETIYRVMTEELNVPANDRFQAIAEHEPATLILDPHYLGIERSANAIAVQITLNAGRSVDLKRAFYARLAAELETAIALRPQDLFISLVEVPKENWSFGNGEAQYAEPAVPSV